MIRHFGITAAGAAVQAITLQAGGLSATILTLGAILQSVRLEGLDHGLTLGSDRLADYEGALCWHGALVGPVANRIANARATVAGRLCRFAANDGPHCLHSGPDGTHPRIWTIAAHGPDHLTLTLDLPDGVGGFPGQRHLQAEWHLRPTELCLTLTARSDAATLINLANHSYWNLDGSADFRGHHLRIAADRMTEVDGALIPTGRLLPVAGSAFDFRQGRPVVPGAPALDTNFCLSDRPEDLRDVLWLTGQGGLSLTLATTEPGLQVYDHRAPADAGHGAYAGLAIEPQHWPDAPNQPAFPPILLQPHETRRQITRWRFSR